MSTAAVEVRNLVKEFDGGAGQTVRAVDDVSLVIGEGEFFAMLGPSGCGKTTTLRVIAGFEDPTGGEVLLRGRPVLGVPPFHRPVNTVFQDYALFPHMTVLQNVTFGLRMARVAPAEARRRALEALEMVHLPDAGDRRPSQLSGGMKQRVALARALVNRPAVLLLDEPLGALDLKLRKAMQEELKQLQQRVGITFVYVTHDQEEALTMADRIAVMSAGRALQIGTPDAVYERPSSRFVADFIGETNFLEGTLEARHGERGVVRLEGGATVEAALRDPEARVGHPVAVAVRPEKIGLAVEGATGSAGDGTVALAGEVADVQYIGTDTRYRVRLRGAGAAPVVVRVQNRRAGYDAMWSRGTEVVASWSRDHASVLA